MIDNNVERIKDCVEEIMEILHIEKDEDNELTGLRIAKMLSNELFANRNNLNIQELDSKMKLFNSNGCDSPIVISGIPVFSMCSHHWMPFYGECKVTYIPNEEVLGLSKFPRVVKYFSKKPQLQEYLTNEIGEYLVNILDPLSLQVEIKCTHTCVSGRGIESNCDVLTNYNYNGGL